MGERDGEEEEGVKKGGRRRQEKDERVHGRRGRKDCRRRKGQKSSTL